MNCGTKKDPRQFDRDDHFDTLMTKLKSEPMFSSFNREEIQSYYREFQKYSKNGLLDLVQFKELLQQMNVL